MNHRQKKKKLKREQREHEMFKRKLESVKAEIKHFMFEVNPSSSESDFACNYILDVIRKYEKGTNND